jgi:hypothetical protein
MAQPCKTCTAENRDEIEEAIVANPSLSAVGRQFGINRDTLTRHRQNHMSPAIRAAHAASKRSAEVGDGLRLLDRVTGLLNDAQAILADAKAQGKPSIALAAIREARGLLETYGKATGELKPDGQVTVQVLNVATNPQWLAIRDALSRTFARLPNGDEARLLFADEMRQIDGYEEPSPAAVGLRALTPYRDPAVEDEADDEVDDGG